MLAYCRNPYSLISLLLPMNLYSYPLLNAIRLRRTFLCNMYNLNTYTKKPSGYKLHYLMICYSILCLSSINLLGSWFLNRRRLYLQSPPPTSQLSSPLLVIEYEMEARTFAGEYSPPIFKTALNVRFIRRCKSLLLLVPPFLPYS